jgi:hypothetical protein
VADCGEPPSHPDVDGLPAPEEEVPIVGECGTGEGREPDNPRARPKTRAIDYDRRADAAAALAYSITASWVGRASGSVPETVNDAPRLWLDPQAICHFLGTLIGRIILADQ